MRRFADCFTDRRDPRYVEHQVETLVGQRIFGLALGYEDLNDHDELRKDPTFAVLAGKLSPMLRTDCEPLAGKSTLNRLEHTPRRHAAKYHKIDCDGAQVDALLVDLFLDAHERAPREIVLDLDNTDIPLHGTQEGRFFHGYYEEYCYLRLYAVLPESQWRGYRPPQEPPAAPWRDTLGAAIPPLPSALAQAALQGDLAGKVHALASDPKDGLAAALARLGQAFMARDL